MVYVISDNFHSPLGTWDWLAPWDGTERSDSAKGFLTTQSHVDIRNFREIDNLVNVPQNPDLDTALQTALDSEEQTAMEQKKGAPIVTENWTLSSQVTEDLTFSGNEITDATRQAALGWGTTQLGGSTDGAGLVDGYHNMIVNGDFETNTSGWAANSGGVTLTSDSTHAFSGSKSCKIVTPGLVLGEGIVQDFATGITAHTHYTVAFWVFAPAGQPIAASLQAYTSGFGSFLGQGADTLVGNGSWQFMTITFLMPATAATAALFIATNNTAATTFWVDSVTFQTGTVPIGGAGPFTMTTPNGVGIYRAATNLFLAGQCDVVTGWDASTTGVTVSLDTNTPAPFSPQSAKVVSDGSVSNQGISVVVGGTMSEPAGTVATGSVWFKGVAGASYFHGTTWGNTDSTFTGSVTHTFTATGSWQLITPDPVTVAAGKTGDAIFLFVWQNGAARPETIWAAHAMVEIAPTANDPQDQSPYVATSGASTASRGTINIEAPSGLITATQGWFACRVKSGLPSTEGSANGDYYFQLGDGTFNNRVGGYHDVSTGDFFTVLENAGSAEVCGTPFPFNYGDDFTVIFKWTAADYSVSVNGGAFVTNTRTTGIPSAGMTAFDIGQARGFGHIDSSILWAACGRGTLSNTDAATINGFGNTPPSFGSVPGTVTAVWQAVTASFTSEPGVTNLTIGPIAARGGWSGLQVTTDGDVIDAFLQSLMPDNPVDISAMEDVLVILPDYNSLDSTSNIQFTSDPSGIFGNGHDSANQYISASLDPMPEWRFHVSSLTNTGFDNTKITGVQITLSKAAGAPANETITFMGLRAVTSGWTESALDFDTRLGAIYRPVTLTGNNYSGFVAQSFEFVRGDGSKNDPIPADGAYYIYFYPGGSTSPNDATGSNFNAVAAILREQKDTTDGTGSHIQATLYFNDTSTSFQVANVSSTGGSPGTEVYSNVVNETIGPALDPSTPYVLQVQIQGTQIQAALYKTDINQNVGDLVWQNTSTITDASYSYKNGRVGFVAYLLSRDAYVSGFEVATTGFATFQTGRYISRTPVDGAQLAAVYSEDENLFNSVTGPDLFIDTTKTISGLGSFRTARSITTNSFIVDDWTQSYLSLGIWVPSNVTKANQPVILLNTNVGQENIPLPMLQPSQWNTLYFDLGLFRSLVTASAYSLTISAAPSPDRALGYFWVDEIVVGRRRVQWSARATTNGPWRDFKSQVNNPSGAIHFIPEERGTELQLQAVALTDDAWVSSFKLFPRYAQLGLPVYDQGFETD